ncbi:MAG: vWA domain-containing protein [Methanosarcina sp.]
MSEKHQVHNLIILDESGSMSSIKQPIISGFNELVQTIKGIEKEFAEQEHFISLVTFNGLGKKILHFIDPAGKLNEIDDARYQPNADTPLFDAMGFAFNKLMKFLEGKNDYNVLVTILTDGEENSSKEYNEQAIKSLIEELKNKNWTFTYIGTDHDVEKFAVSVSITNTMMFEKNNDSMHNMFMKEQSARHRYSANIREKKETKDDFYKEE